MWQSLQIYIIVTRGDGKTGEVSIRASDRVGIGLDS